jgi:hypothetical protein
MKVGRPVAQNKAVNVLGPGHFLQGSRQTVHQFAQGARFWVCEIAQAYRMSPRLGHEISPICRHLFGGPIGVPGIDQFILVQNTSGGGIAHRVFCADEAILEVHLKDRRAGRGVPWVLA